MGLLVALLYIRFSVESEKSQLSLNATEGAATTIWPRQGHNYKKGPSTGTWRQMFNMHTHTQGERPASTEHHIFS